MAFLEVPYSFAQQSGGCVEVWSVPNEGTRFQIYLPVVDRKPLEIVAEVKEIYGAYILSLTDRFAGCRGPVLVAMRSPKSGFSGHGPLCYVRTD